MRETTKREKPVKRVEAVARLLCELWDDSWYLGKKFHTENAERIIKLSDSMKRKGL